METIQHHRATSPTPCSTLKTPTTNPQQARQLLMKGHVFSSADRATAVFCLFSTDQPVLLLNLRRYQQEQKSDFMHLTTRNTIIVVVNNPK